MTMLHTPVASIKNPDPFTSKEEIEVRTIIVEGVPRPFRVMTVDSAEKWKEASEYKLSYCMYIQSANQRMTIPMNAISLQQWDALEQAHVIPQWRIEGQKPTDEFDIKHKLAILNKQIAIFELAIGKKIPGANATEKQRWLEERSSGDAIAITNYIFDVACGFESGRLVADYNQALSTGNSDASKVIEFTDFADWDVASKTKHFFRMSRSFEDYIMEIPMSGITSAKKAEIEQETKEPDAPMLPSKLPNGRFDVTNIVPNYEDYNYLKSVRAVQQRRTVLYLNACLPFQIPGQNFLEQYAWLSRRIVGDVQSIRQFIDRDMMSYRGRLDFLSGSSSLNA